MPGRSGSLPRISEEGHQKWLLVKTKCDLGGVRVPFWLLQAFVLEDAKDKVDRLSLLSFKHLPPSYVPRHHSREQVLPISN